MQQLESARGALGWDGHPVGPVRHLGATVWPVVVMSRGEVLPAHGGADNADPAGPVRGQSGAAARLPEVSCTVVGCLLAGSASRELVDAASLFAGFSARAIVVPAEDECPVGVLVDAALLDQGVVAVGADQGGVVLNVAGPKVVAGDVAGRSPSWLEVELVEKARSAAVAAAGVTP